MRGRDRLADALEPRSHESKYLDEIETFIMTNSDEIIIPYRQFNLGEFRWTAARYIKRLIRARWKSDPDFLSEEELTAWKLNNIANDTQEAWQLLQLAAKDIGILNRDFLPREGSGGVAEVGDPIVGGLIWSLSFLVPTEGGGPDHNQALFDAAEAIKSGKNLDWEDLVDWKQLSGIREELDQLPESEPSGGLLDPEPVPQTPNEFRYDTSSKMWTVTYEGKSLTPGHLDGFFYICEILKERGGLIEPIELRERILAWKSSDSDTARQNRERVTVGSHDQSGDNVNPIAADSGPAIDKLGIKQIQKLIEVLDSRIDTAKLKGEAEDAMILEEERNQLEDYISKNTGHRGRPRNLQPEQ